MKVGEYSPVNKAASAGKKRNVSSAGGGFFELLNAADVENTPGLTPTSDISSVGSMDALLSLQEMPDDEANRKKALQQGDDVVSALEALRASLLSGNVTHATLEELQSALLLKKHFVNDPALNSLINAIELRAAVELAKLERARKN